MKSIRNGRLVWLRRCLHRLPYAGVAQAEDLTLCWAAWDPANALVELSKDFTEETGIDMKFEFVPWTELCRPLPQRAELARASSAT